MPSQHHIGLTPKQAECYQALAHYFREHGYAPSLQELSDMIGIATKSGIHRLLLGLEERGYIKRMFGRPRAITLLKADNVIAMAVATLNSKNSVDNVRNLTEFLYGLDSEGKALFMPLLREWLTRQDAALNHTAKEQINGENRERETA